MKIKDLNPKTGLGGVRFRYPGDGQLYYWHSQWQKGVWGKKSLSDERVYPLDCDDLSNTAEWEVVDFIGETSVPSPSDSVTASSKPK